MIGTNRVAAVAGGIVAVFVSLPFWADPGLVFLAGVTATEAMFAMSWNLMFGTAGLVSFGHAAFFAVGAYGTGAFLKYAPGVPFPLALLATCALGAAVSCLVGLLALRRVAGIYFAILTLALGEALHLVIGYSDALGRDDGLAAIPRPVMWGFDLGRGDAYYWFILGMVALAVAALWRLERGPVGRTLRAIRDEPDRAAFLGVDVQGYRLFAFTVGGGLAALAGALQAPWTQIVTPGSATWVHSIAGVLNTLLGGAASFWGPMIGTAVFTGLQYATRTLPGLSELLIGGVLLVVVLAMPGGIAGLLSAGATGRRTGRLRRLAPKQKHG